MNRRRAAILISGRGSNMASLLLAATAADYPARFVVVISNRPDAAGLRHAADVGVATEVVDHKNFGDRAGFEVELDARLRAHRVDLVCLAGFMRLLTAPFVESWRDRLINIHPSLLPAFPGLDTHVRALAAGVRFAGCTVHLVRPEMDSGPIVAQAVVPILPRDDEASLAARVLLAEHRLYPFAVRLIAEGGATLVGGRVEYGAGQSFPEPALFSPTPR